MKHAIEWKNDATSKRRVSWFFVDYFQKVKMRFSSQPANNHMLQCRYLCKFTAVIARNKCTKIVSNNAEHPCRIFAKKSNTHTATTSYKCHAKSSKFVKNTHTTLTGIAGVGKSSRMKHTARRHKAYHCTPSAKQKETEEKPSSKCFSAAKPSHCICIAWFEE